MIYDKQTLAKCSLEQLRKFKQEHKEEIERLLNEWFSLEEEPWTLTARKNDYDWYVKACSERINNIQHAISDKL